MFLITAKNVEWLKNWFRAFESITVSAWNLIRQMWLKKESKGLKWLWLNELNSSLKHKEPQLHGQYFPIITSDSLLWIFKTLRNVYKNTTDLILGLASVILQYKYVLSAKCYAFSEQNILPLNLLLCDYLPQRWRDYSNLVLLPQTFQFHSNIFS